MSPESLSPLPPIVGAPLFAIAFFVIASALGFRFLRLLNVPTVALSPWEHGFLSATLGTGLLQMVPCTLAVFGLMTRGYVRIACALVALALAKDALRFLRAGTSALRRLSGVRPAPAVRVWVLLLSLVLGVFLVRALVFRSFGDDDGYHLSSPKRWLASGALQYLPTFTHTNASLGFEMLYVIALSFSDVIGAKLLHYGAGLFTLAGIYLAGKRLGNPFAAIVVISLVLIETPVLNLPLLFTVAYVDFGASWMAMASVLLWVIWRAEKHDSLFIAFALCAGLAGSFKFTSLALGVAWAPALIYVTRKAGGTWLASLARVARFALISVAPVIPWLVRNGIETGNPLYPLLSSVIHTRDWSDAHASVFARYVHYYSWGVAQGSRLGQGTRQNILFATGLALVVTSVLAFRLIRGVELRVILIFALNFTLISLASTGMIFRYWMPALLAAALAVSVAVTQRWSAAPWRYWPACGLLFLALLKTRTVRVESGRSFLKDLKVATGLSSFSAEYPDDTGWQMWKAINSRTPPDARLLAASFYTSYGASSFGGFWVDRSFYVTDSHLQEYIRLDGWLPFIQSVARERIDYVIIFDQQGSANRHGFSFLAAENEYPFCRRLVDSFGEEQAHFGTLRLYHVHPERALMLARANLSP